MKIGTVFCGMLLSSVVWGQPSQTTEQTGSLPDVTVGLGVSWNRGSVYPLSADTNIAIHLGATSKWYSWTTVSTPIATSPQGTSPLPSSLRTGGAYVAAQSSTGVVSLIMIVGGGFSATSNNLTPIFDGNVGVPVRVKQSGFYVMPYIRATNASLGGLNGAAISAMVQPGVMLLYGFRLKR